MRMYSATFAALLCCLLLLAGCAEEKQTIQTTQVITTASDTQRESGRAPAHDIDPEAVRHGAQGIPFYYDHDGNYSEIVFYPSADAVKREGRYIEHNDIYYLSCTCSAVSFRMSGDRLSAVMMSNGNVYPDDRQCYIGVLINGEPRQRIRLLPGENSYTLYEGEELKNAEVSIVKLTENQMATAGIKSISANAAMIAPCAREELSIEFIGDSIVCGYGNESDSPSDGYNSANQNGLKTYCYYAAKELGAELSIVGISGIGIISDYTSTAGVKEDYLLMPYAYEYSDANFQLRRGIEELTPWDFGGGSDIVVINLGTNDYTYTGDDEGRCAEFERAYYDLIGSVRGHNPNARIICTMGIMGDELFDEIESAARAYSADNSDERIYTLRFDRQREENGFGGDYHPTAATHMEAAEQLVEFINSIS